MGRRSAGWICGLVLGASTACAAPPAEHLLPPIRAWDASDLGVSHQNWSVIQHSSGLIYVGNGNRVLEFDGATWRSLPTPNVARVRSLVEGPDERVYVGSIEGFGVLEPDAAGSLNYRSLADGAPSGFGDIWRVVRLGESIHFMSRGTLFRHRPGAALEMLASRSSFRNLFEVDGRLLVSEQNQPAAWLDFDTGARTPLACAEGLGATMVSAAASVGTDTFLFTAERAFRFDGRCVVPWAETSSDLLRAAWPYAAVATADGELVVGTIRGGVLVFARDGTLQRQLRSTDGLLSDTVLGVGVDRSGGLWLAQEGGIARIEWSAGVSALRTAQLQALSSVVRYRGTLLAGTALGVFAVRPGADARTAKVSSYGPPRSNVNALLAHESGLLVAARDGVSLWNEGRDTQLLRNDFGYSLARSRRAPDIVHVGLAPGYARLRHTSAGWRTDRIVPGIEDTIVTLAEDGDGRTWLGTERGRIYRVDVAGDAVPVVERFDAAHGLPAGNTMPFDLGNEVVFATTQGVMRFEHGDRFVADARFAEGIAHGETTAFRLEAAADGRIFARIGGDGGWFEPRSAGAHVWHGRALGVLPKSSTLDFLVEADGAWFARDRDLAYRDFRRRVAPSWSLPVLLRSVTHGDRLLFGGAGPLALAPRPTDALAWRVEFAWPQFAAPQRIEYRARVVGQAADAWSPWRETPTHTFERLPGGDYALEVEARDALGRGAGAGRWAFAITPPWFATPAGRIAIGGGLALVLLGASWLGVRWRTRRLEAANLRLERQVQARTDEVRAQAERLRAQDVARTRFFANVSHEFRTPLTLILGPLDDLRHGRFGALPRTVGDQIATATRNARRLLGLVNQILDLNRLEAGQLRLKPRALDFAAFLRDASEPFVGLAERKALHFECPSPEASLPCTVDPDAMGVVVQNLLSNAFKFTPSGGTVRLLLAADDTILRLSVRDSGIGIPAGELAHVFERYYQGADGDQPMQPGTGIGLALVKELVELHGGRVAVHSEPGQGSRFEVELPRHAARTAGADDSHGSSAVDGALPADAAPLATPDVDAPGDIDDGTRTTVLVVDDNAELREFVAQRLRDRYRVLFAADGEEGLTVARAELPDLVVSDVMMPVCDGFTLLDRLRADPEIGHLPVILLTARSAADDLVSGLRKGADDYLVKPFDTTELRVRIERLIQLRHRLRDHYANRAASSPPSAPDVAVTAPPDVDDPFLARVRAVALRHLSDSGFGVQQLADAVHLDRTQLYRRLTQAGGVPPQQFLRELRLDRAAELLRQRAGSVSEIAYGVGFESLSHFSRTYRERFGRPPSADAQGTTNGAH
jgi:signal transduction histidine kinase/CheY-like chemotaxis protein